MSTTQQEYWQATRGKKVMKRYARSPNGKKSQNRYVEKLARAKALAESMGLWE